MQSLPHKVYSPEQVRSNELLVAKKLGIESFELMRRAGQSAFDLAITMVEPLEHIAVFCGAGNNGGDGYIVATLALQRGIKVDLYQIGDVSKFTEDAATARAGFIDAGGEELCFEQILLADCQLVVDALIGTGLKTDTKDAYTDTIHLINASEIPVLAVDIPSGLHAESGRPRPFSVRATATITFVGLKRGLLTGQAKEHCGELHFAGLGIEEAFDQHVVCTDNIIQHEKYRHYLAPRPRHFHKGNCGKILAIGGQPGYSGAITLAALGALRSGAGLVQVLTHPKSVAPVAASQPELMVSGVEAANEEMGFYLEWADVILLGPGLGRDIWGREMFHGVMSMTNKPMVLDADGLNHLAAACQSRHNWILTPHPGEAARLLQVETKDAESDRYYTASSVQEIYGGVVAVKGAGTIVTDGQKTRICTNGNPGMATGGMGDVLSGICAGFLGQGIPPFEAASVAVDIHARAGDIAAQKGERGMLPSDLFEHIRALVNEY